MNIFGLEIGRKGMTAQEFSRILLGAFGGTYMSNSGQSVTPERAMRVATVFACVRILAESMAQLPFGVYKKDSLGNIEKQTKHGLYNVLKWQANDYQTAFEFIEMLTSHVALRGNGYAFISWDRAKNEVLELLPFHPDSVKVEQKSDWSLEYKVTMIGGNVETIPAGNIFHLRGLSGNGYSGLSPIAYHKNIIGLSLATESHGANLFKNGARPGGVLRHPKKLKDDVAARILEGWKAAHGGGNTGGTAILEEGMEYESVALTNEDAQYLETRKFQRIELSQVFRIPAAMLDIHDKAATYASAEQFFLSFVKFTMLPWVKRWEQAVRRDLLSEQDKQAGVYPELNVAGMERGDLKTRYEAYGKGIDKGILCPNDCRKTENMPPREGGDEFLKPLNMEVSGKEETEKTIEPVEGLRKSNDQENGSLGERNQLVDRYRPKLKKAAAKIVGFEASKIRAALDSDVNFVDWLDAFGSELSTKVKMGFAIVLSQYMTNVKVAALKDVDTENIEGLGDYNEQYLDIFANRWADSSTGQIKALIADIQEDEISERVNARVSEWEEKRAQKVANDEAVRVGNSVSRFVWAAAGVNFLIWKTQGSKTCPFCHQLSGRKVGISVPFIDRGETLTASDGSNMKIRGKKMHPPIHRGCKCAILPG